VIDKNLTTVSSPPLQDHLRGGAAYSFASQIHQLEDTFAPELSAELEDIYTRAFKSIWWVGLGISVFAFFAVAGEKGLELRKDLDTEYGLDDKKHGSS